MIGRTISGRYVVQKQVGMGGMAIVYRAFDKKTNRVVAIKVLRPEYESDAEFVRRFSREAEAASKVSHENIVTMLDVGTDGDLRYIVMEYVEHTLKDLIQERGYIKPDKAIRMTIRILAAVDHAHRNGIVHRDIKPQNILVDNQDRVKVTDFGIARLKTAQTINLDSQTSSQMGSAHYLSPEQAKGEVADEKSDLYSVGVVMYEMLTGQVPFEGDNPYSVVYKHVSEQPTSMRQLRDGISKALDEVVMRALCKDASKRYQTAAEMAGDLRKCITRPQGGFVRYPKDPEDEEEDRKKKIRNYKRLKRLMIICLVAGVIAMIGAGVWYYDQMRTTFEMPSVVGEEQVLAQDALERRGATVNVVYSYSEDFEEGVVFGQSLRAGARGRYDVPVTLTVSRGTRYYYLENYVGQRAEDAESALRGQGVESVAVEFVQADSPVGTVVSVAPEMGLQAKDTQVVLSVSGRRVLMPSLVGLTQESAAALLRAQGLVVGAVSEGYSADAKPHTVIAQGVSPNSQVLAGTVVDLTVNQTQAPTYYPVSKLSVVVPLNASSVRLTLQTPSGATQEVYQGVLNAGTYRFALSSAEPGDHTVSITMDGVLMEKQTIHFR